MYTLAVLMFMVSVIFLVLAVFKPETFFVLAIPENRTRIKAIKTGVALVLFFFFLTWINAPQSSFALIAVGLLVMLGCLKVIFANTRRSEGSDTFGNAQFSVLPVEEVKEPEPEKVVQAKAEEATPPAEPVAIPELSPAIAEALPTARPVEEERIPVPQKPVLTPPVIATPAELTQEELEQETLRELIDNNVFPEAEWSAVRNVQPKYHELLYYAQEAELRATKNVRTTVTYATQVEREVVNTLDYGTFWISNQRVGFDGFRRSFVIPVNRLTSVEINEYLGLFLARDGKVQPQMIGLASYDIPGAIISKLINR